MKPLEEKELAWFRGHWQAEADRLSCATPRTEHVPIPHEWLANALLLRLFCGWGWFKAELDGSRTPSLSGTLVPPHMTGDAIQFAGIRLRHVPQTITAETLQIAVRGMVAYDQHLFKRWLKANPLATHLDQAVEILRMQGYNF